MRVVSAEQFEATSNAWEQRYAVPAISDALHADPALDGLSEEQFEALTSRLLDAVRPLWLTREQIAMTGGVEAVVIATLVAQPDLTWEQSVDLVLAMLHNGDPAQRGHAEQIVADARSVGKEADPWADIEPEVLPQDHMAKVIEFRRR